jgi:hypothetical protein
MSAWVVRDSTNESGILFCLVGSTEVLSAMGDRLVASMDGPGCCHSGCYGAGGSALACGSDAGVASHAG